MADIRIDLTYGTHKVVITPPDEASALRILEKTFETLKTFSLDPLDSRRVELDKPLEEKIEILKGTSSVEEQVALEGRRSMCDVDPEE